MNETYETRMLALVEAVSQLTGLHAVWKNASGTGEGNLPLSVYSHCNPFCLAVKACPGALEKCTKEDNVQTALEASRNRRPFFKTCHAGVTELVVPLFDAGRFDGLLFIGPTRRSWSRCDYGPAKDAFEALPAFDAKVFAAAEAILHTIATELAFRKQSLRLRESEDRELDPRIAQAVEIIKGELNQTLRASALARRCFLSPSRFVHLFKASMGVPVSTYIAQMRVERAKALLTHSDLALSGIAAEVGFPNQNYFATVFRRHCGMAPSHYRRQTQLDPSP